MDMQVLLSKIKNCEARSTAMLAEEMNMTPEDVTRTLEYLERIGVLRRTELGKFECNGSCSSCSGCSGSSGNNKGPCKGCIPEQGFEHMGVLWEVKNG